MKLKNNLDEVLYERIIEGLISGDYRMGQKLTLDELAEKFGVSRTPVVQAVKQLANDGILSVLSSGRIFVPEFDYTTVKQICEVRQLIECYALDVLMSKSDEYRLSVLSGLEQYAEQCIRLDNEQRHLEFATTDRKFHRLLVESGENSVLTETYLPIQDRFSVANYLISPLKDRDFKTTADNHCQLLESIRNRDLAQAQLRLADHISRVVKVFDSKDKYAH